MTPPEHGLLRDLRVELTALCDENRRIRLLAEDVGLASSRMNFEGAAQEVWHEVIREAHRSSRLLALIDRVLGDYSHVERLRALRAEFAALQPGSPPSSPAPEPEALLVVHAIDHERGPQAAIEEIDWVELYEGDDPRSRRLLKDPTLWNTRLRDDLAEVERRLRSAGHLRVRVAGHMRLTTWFMVGATLARTRGFQVSCMQGGDLWTSRERPEPCLLRREVSDLGRGVELAVSLSVTTDARAEVDAYVREVPLAVASRVDLAVEPNPSRHAIRGPAYGLGCATAVLDAIREQVRVTRPTQLHLFASTPAGVMFLLGHFWNALPRVQLYEHLAPGYAPGFVLEG